MYLRNCINWNKKKRLLILHINTQIDRWTDIYTDIHALKTSANSRHFA